MTEGRRAALLCILIIALPALVLVAKQPAHSLILSALNNAAHAPVFGALAVVWFQLMRQFSTLSRWPRYVAAFALAVAIGGTIELIQPAFGGDAEISDLINDALGAIAGLALLVARESRLKIFLVLAIAALVPVVWPIGEASIAYAARAHDFPTLLGKSPRTERLFIHTSGIELTASVLPLQWQRRADPQSLKIRITGGRYPVFTSSEPEPDWRGYSRLMLDITNPDPRPLKLTLRIHDRDSENFGTDHFDRKFRIGGSERRVMAFPLAEIGASPAGRVLDRSRVTGVIILGDGNPHRIGRAYYLTRLWLE